MTSEGMIATCALCAIGCGRVAFDTLPADAPDDTDTAEDVSPDSPARQFAFVQENDGDGGATNTHAVSFTTPVTSGDLIVVAFDYDAPGAFAMQVVDTLGSPYLIQGPFSNGTNHQYIAYAVATQPGSDTVTVTGMGTSGSYFEVRVHEYAGGWSADPLDQCLGGNGGSLAVDGATTPPFVTTQPDELVFAFITFGGGGTKGTGFTLRSSLANDVSEDLIAATPGTYVGTGTMSSGTSWTACGATFFTH